MFFDDTHIYADLCSNHRGDEDVFLQLCHQIRVTKTIPKIQLYSEQTFPRAWGKYLDFTFIPSVFRPADVDYILPLQPLALKIASVESTYQELLHRCLDTDLPLIVSTGGMNEDEVVDLLAVAGEHAPGLCLMHCVSIYPTPKEQVNLGRLASLDELVARYGFDEFVTLGWSSHYPYYNPAMLAMAYAFGATQFEFHVKPDTTSMPPTLDEQCALTVGDLKVVVDKLKELDLIYGDDNQTGPDREAVLEWRQRWLNSPDLAMRR